MRQWQVQLGAGLQVSASSPTAVAGAVLLLGLGIGSLRLWAPCRVVYAVDEPRRRGFAYGTLAGHLESGEEAFMIEHHDDDSVSFRITAFSRPATRLAKIAGPLGAVVQRQITAAYLRSPCPVPARHATHYCLRSPCPRFAVQILRYSKITVTLETYTESHRPSS